MLTNSTNSRQLAVNNKFEALQDLLQEEETTMESTWKRIKEALTSKCKEILDRNEHHHKEWISIETLNRCQESKNKRWQLTTA
ncbi:unnamed protein product [Schistosoma curassoni]|uniref:Uncharacterized protein n=1 Tax=Schistosoma curassoni TaxID=6186 RepID=A0A183KUP8_9TREM|nr:unnamed protein product [Schistosoma curassoni]